MKIISFKICPFVQRVTALLEAKGIAYDVDYISLKAKPQWFLDMSPNGQVPVLITDTGAALFESDAITEYLEEAYPALQDGLSAERKAENRAWSYLASKTYLVQCGAQRSPNAKVLADKSKKLDKAFDTAERWLGDTRFFNSETLGMVDIAWLVLLHRSDIVARKSGYDFIGDRPKLKQWRARLLETGLAEASVAPDFEDAFSSFYLSHETYLGRGADVAGCNAAAPHSAGGCC